MKEKYVFPSAILLIIGAEDVLNSSKTIIFSDFGSGDTYDFKTFFGNNS